MGGRDRFGDVVVGGIAGRRAGSEASIDDDSRRSLCPSPAVGKRQDFPVGLAKTNTWAAASVSWCDLYRSLQNMAEKLRERTAACLMDRRSFWSDVPVELIDQDIIERLNGVRGLSDGISDRCVVSDLDRKKRLCAERLLNSRVQVEA